MKESDDDNLSVYTQIQLQKEPNKGILKATCPGETADDRERWASAIKLLTFFGINFEKSSDFLIQTSRHWSYTRVKTERPIQERGRTKFDSDDARKN